MAIFIGSEKEFNDHIGPRIRNRIQTLTKPYKPKSCQHCGKSGVALEAAHLHGFERKAVIHELLQNYKSEAGYTVDLDAFDAQLVEAHKPISDHFLFLCRECHREYDSQPSKVDVVSEDTTSSTTCSSQHTVVKISATQTRNRVRVGHKVMTRDMIEACYDSACRIFRGSSDAATEKNRLVKDFGMNPASATYYLYAISALLNDGAITYDINKDAVDCYLKHIGEDFGREAQKIACGVCYRRYEYTKKNDNTCFYYKRLADKYR